MRTVLASLGVIIGIALVVGLFVGMWLWGSYNTLVVVNQQTETSWASVQTEYQRRFDLIPNLVAATKGTMSQEREVFGAIADARTHYASAAPSDKVQATQQYESAISRLLIVMENYPVLQSNSTVQNLMGELAGTENRVQVSRDRYNQTVQTYNITIKQFPKNLIASMFGYAPKEQFQAEEGTAASPKVDLTI